MSTSAHTYQNSLSFSFHAHATSSLFSFLTRRPFIPSCFNDLLPSIEYQLPLPDPTSAASSPCGRAGQATWKSRCEKMTLDLTPSQAEFKTISRKAKIWPCLDALRWNGSTTLPRPREQQRAAAVLKTSRHRWVNFLYFYMLRTSELRSHWSIVCAFLAFVFIQMCLYYLEDINTLVVTIVCVFVQIRLVSFAIALGTSL